MLELTLDEATTLKNVIKIFLKKYLLLVYLLCGGASILEYSPYWNS